MANRYAGSVDQFDSMAATVLKWYFGVGFGESIERNSRPTIGPSQARTSPTRVRTWIGQHCPGTPWLALDDRECHFDAGYVNVFLLPDMYESGVG